MLSQTQVIFNSPSFDSLSSDHEREEWYRKVSSGKPVLSALTGRDPQGSFPKKSGRDHYRRKFGSPPTTPDVTDVQDTHIEYSRRGVLTGGIGSHRRARSLDAGKKERDGYRNKHYKPKYIYIRGQTYTS